MGKLVDRERFRPTLPGVMNSMSDRRLQFHLLDRITFKRFVGLGSLDRVPDRKTLWKYRNQLAEAGVVEELFDLFRETLPG